MVFFSVGELNAETVRLLKACKNLFFQRKEASRKELLQYVERSCRKSLP